MKTQPDKPRVSISLPIYLEAFCRFIFDTPKTDSEITISRVHDIGKLIHSNVQISEFPTRKDDDDSGVVFILPVNQHNYYSVTSHFISVSAWGKQKIVDGIEYEYRKWIERRFEIGYKKGFSQKQIIDAILRALNLRDNTVNFDAIKKIDYRNRRKLTEKRFFELLNDD